MIADRRAFIYGQMADKLERDPYGPDGSGRAIVVNGRGFRWARFNRAADLVWVESIDGKMVALTPWQAKVYDLARSLIDNGTMTIRDMATTLHCAPSTVSRALVKLASFGLLGYLTGRGRYAGTLIFSRVKGDGLDRFRDLAKATVRRWKEAADRRLSRLWINVAPYIFEEEGDWGSSYKAPYYQGITKGATLTAQLPWTAEEVAGIV